MPKPRRKTTKRQRAEAASLGGSPVARLSFERPGGRHDRRREPRRVARQRAIRESE